VPGRSLVLRRNPNYGGQRPQGLSEIRYSIGTSLERGVQEVEAGRADYVDLHEPLARDVALKTQRRLSARYGPHSRAANAGRQQLFTQPLPTLNSFAFNTVRRPFADARLRRAVNYAIDRRRLARDWGIGEPGRPTDQYIPPGVPGFEDAAIYPLGEPDVARARRLADGIHRRAVLYTCNTPGCTRGAQILRSNLAAIGIRLEIRQFPFGEMFYRTRRRGEPWDMMLWGWGVDYADPFNFINDQFAARAIDHPGGFHNRGMERRMAAAARLTGEARLRAYAELDHDLAEQFAPQATFVSGEASYFLSARIGCVVPHPIYGLDVAALCLRGK
jgi:ABC-type oligopeptide transport system substrate-binding subunit